MKNVYIPSLEICEKLADEYGTPFFITDAQTLRDRVASFKNAFGQRCKIYFAIKANFNPHTINVLKSAGIDGIDAVSPFEIELAKTLSFRSNQIIFTGNGSSDEELKSVMKEEVLCNIGSISELERFGRMFPKANVSIRLNPGVGDGENENVITAGDASKFGIIERDFAIAKALINKFELQLKGLHCHIGSGFYKTEVFAKAVFHILQTASQFPSLDFIDLGGGFGVRYHEDQAQIDLISFGSSIMDMVNKFEEENGKPVELRFEPGKYLVSESTCLVSKITTRKSTRTQEFVCLDTGFHHLIRPALYGSNHQIVNLNRKDGDKIKATVVGNVCESTDVFGKNVEMVDPKEGDLVALVSAGAYGSSMSSLYNLRPYASEVMVDGSNVTLTRKRQSFVETFQSLGFV
ncbi:MAG: diaminopimelate decarboxylase [Bdellovibrionales bacterium]|nr:diaminopimelate decarboxylase [Bdellovibrionales bacterium]